MLYARDTDAAKPADVAIFLLFCRFFMASSQGVPWRRKPMAPNKALRCPTCRTLVLEKDQDFPFCSDRCRRIDLGKWASGEYRISSPILDPEVLEGLAEHARRPQQDNDDD
jgi:endogenous inhibitor of DNA gyrase (YacG/DUF329 family)